MDFYLILQSILDEKNISIPDAARMCGLSDGTLRSAIVRKQQKVAVEVAYKLSDGLNVSLERLNGMPEPPNAHSLLASPDENKLLSNYRSLNIEGQEKLIDYSADLTRIDEYKKRDKSGRGEKEA